MSFLRTLIRDLVDKKLWPVAAALVLALVAVPVLLGSGGSAAPAPRAPGAGAGSTAGAPVATAARVSLDSAVRTAKRNRAGAVRNPFVQQHQPKAAPVAGATATAAPSAPAKSAPSSGTPTRTGAGTQGKSTTPAVTQPAAPRRVVSTVARRRVFRVAIRFGEMGALKTRHDAARLTALPSTAKPLALFLGVRSDLKTAVFLLAPGVQARGEGWCRPTPVNCHTLEMRAGDHEVLEAASGTGGVVQYHLVAARVAKRTLKSLTRASRKHSRVSKAGRELLRSAAARDIPGTGSYRFDLRYGVLRAR